MNEAILERIKDIQALLIELARSSKGASPMQLAKLLIALDAAHTALEAHA